MVKMRSIPCVAVLLSLTLARTVLAQNSGKVVGQVIDADSNQPLIGANVIIEGTALGAATDVDGNFIILRVPPGKYSITAFYIGYQRATIQNVQVLTDLTSRADFQLPTEVVQGETVVIIAETQVVRKDLTSVEARVQAEEIEKMPVEEMDDLLNIQAGVTRDAGGGLHIRGGRSSEVSYLVNGISITDDFSRTQSIQIENESIQELQVISGTFNAEYGNAMSGVINVVTKTGGDKLRGNLEFWSGDYISARDTTFFNINDINPLANYNYQASINGPIIKNKLSFFVTGRRWYNDGWLYGANAFLPQGRSQVVGGDTVSVTGDSSAVAMNFRDRWSGQASLEWNIAKPIKFRVDVLGSTEERRFYDHFFRLNPNGDRGDEELGLSVISKLTHVISGRTFHEVTYANKYRKFLSRLYEDPSDPLYVHPDSLNTGALQFAKAGTDLGRFKRTTQGHILKWDLTSQITNRHQVKAGVEAQLDRLYYQDIQLAPKIDSITGLQVDPFEPEIFPKSTTIHNEFTRKPLKFSAYIQDKIEYESLIINVGLRFDLFDANGHIPADPEDPNVYNPFKLQHIYKDLNGDGIIGINEQFEENAYTLAERESFWWKGTSQKSLLSPRLGVAYPITDRGIIHFSYGIFQQVPDYILLYVNDELKLTSAAGVQGPYGNPDLNPEKTTMYELGLKQQLTTDLAVDITGYYRDIRDWISTSQAIPTFISGVSYATYINRDFANVRGITLSVDRRFANNFAFNIDYTFQIAEGTNSDPTQEFFAQLGGDEPTRILTPLNWDQRHSLNANLFIGGDAWGFSLLSRFNSGQPYTPVLVTATRTGQTILAGLRENSRVKPNQFIIDMTAYKDFKFGPVDVQFFARVFNLLDSKSPVNVWGDTGDPDFTLQTTQAAQADPSWFVRSDFYTEPRRIQVGTKVSLR